MAAARRTEYRPLAGTPAWWGAFLVCALVLLAGLAAARLMEHEGHHVTGMTNQVVWGLPHVFAVFLIVAASGALNAASLASVFGRALYKPLARLSAFLALALLAGGLGVLVLDLGRPDRLVVAMTHYNFRSIFAWNIFLYTGFAVLLAAYLWSMMERGRQAFTTPIGHAAFLWRLVLTTGTGSIFGFLVARQAYDTAVLAPLFIAMSLSLGTAAFALAVLGAAAAGRVAVGAALIRRLATLQAIFIAVTLYFAAVQHLTGLYVAERREAVLFVLLGGGEHTALFWLGQVLVGAVVPLLLILRIRRQPAAGPLALAALLVVLGGLAQIYVVIIGGQAVPLVLFPGLEATSGFFDGARNAYAPSLPELALGLGGIAAAGLILLVALRALAVLPASLADADIDPHRRAGAVAPPPAPMTEAA
jgi:molybdopterin-containing oxidoreductase family membrane subunit